VTNGTLIFVKALLQTSLSLPHWSKIFIWPTLYHFTNFTDPTSWDSVTCTEDKETVSCSYCDGHHSEKKLANKTVCPSGWNNINFYPRLSSFKLKIYPCVPEAKQKGVRGKPSSFSCACVDGKGVGPDQALK
jgi:hypothetical protein